jgi:hypothetical protein
LIQLPSFLKNFAPIFVFYFKNAERRNVCDVRQEFLYFSHAPDRDLLVVRGGVGPGQFAVQTRLLHRAHRLQNPQTAQGEIPQGRKCCGQYSMEFFHAFLLRGNILHSSHSHILDNYPFFEQKLLSDQI